MGTDKLVFAVERCGGTTRSDVTGSDISHMTGSDVSHVTGRGPVRSGPDRKYVLRMPGFFTRAFFLVVVTWLPKVT
jgi:hypothetical protein